jgi:hypothetical protein
VLVQFHKLEESTNIVNFVHLYPGPTSSSNVFSHLIESLWLLDEKIYLRIVRSTLDLQTLINSEALQLIKLAVFLLQNGNGSFRYHIAKV